MRKPFRMLISPSSQSLLKTSAKDSDVTALSVNSKLVERRRSFEAFTIRISVRSSAESINQVQEWVSAAVRTRLVTFTNVHMLTEGYLSPGFRKIHSQMDLNCPDGMPLVWLGRLHGKQVTRVCGPEFMQAFCASASPGGIRHFFYGGRNGLAERLIAKLRLQNPSLQVAGCYAPPFRAISPEEDALIVNRINDSGADIVWVSLGCPKQEIWIHEHRDKLNAPVLIAVGLAFDVIAGDKARAPEILRNCGLEWLYRLMQEPARLGVRYLKSNSVFFYMLFQSMFSRPKTRYQ
jgi:N-acetylglucosaminyldiphosphoundecaprenol N-acetyl-beta-D-mannosaminyltransferase